MIKKLLLYLAVFSGCFFEGETTLVTSSFAAHRGYLEIIIVMVIALVATQSWDWIWFLVGRKKGKAFISRKPKLEQKARKIDALLMRNQTLVLLGYRFLYGFRTAVPLTIGMSSIPTRKFFIFSFMNTLVWDGLFSSLGYYFGAFMKANWKRIEHDEFKIMGAMLVMGVLTGLFLRYRSMKKVAVEVSIISPGNPE
jgi:membrane protein DedA with SNARE-associated domain